MLTLTCHLKTTSPLEASRALSLHLLMNLPAEWPEEREESFRIAFPESKAPRVVLTTTWLGTPNEVKLVEIMNQWFVSAASNCPHGIELLYFMTLPRPATYIAA